MGCNTWRFPQGMVMVCIENGEGNNYNEDNHYGDVMFCIVTTTGILGSIPEHN
jgi:hypothetical protein